MAVDTGSVRTIEGVVTQSGNAGQWVVSFRFSVSDDYTTWRPVDGDVVFPGVLPEWL